MTAALIGQRTCRRLAHSRNCLVATSSLSCETPVTVKRTSEDAARMDRGQTHHVKPAKCGNRGPEVLLGCVERLDSTA